MFKKLFIIAALSILLPLSAHAKDPTPLPYPLPPAMVINNVTPPLTIPGEVVTQLQKGAEHCSRFFGTFNFDIKHLTLIDLNDDKRTDYILSSKGFLCSDKRGINTGIEGDSYYFFVSSGPNGALQLFDLDIKAFEMKIEQDDRPPSISLTTPCTKSKAVLRNYGQTIVRWRKDEMDITGRNIGCLDDRTTAAPRVDIPSGSSGSTVPRNVNPVAPVIPAPLAP
ncbi:MAG: hypothetical protein KKA05_07565 [Alphaproteobacteria bacterium]|nr:hypothetical protein [Alphaproteobacteria bacterium]